MPFCVTLALIFPDDEKAHETITLDHSGSLVAVTHLDQGARAGGGAKNQEGSVGTETTGENGADPQ